VVFQLLLWVLAFRINSLAKKHAGFQKAIAGYDVVLQFKTMDNKISRYYQFQQGKTRSMSALHPKPTIAIVFKNAKEALNIIKQMGKDPTDKTIFIYGIRDGVIKIEGDMAYLTWFQVISKYFGPQQK